VPALRALHKAGIPVAGPVPSDTVFSHMAQGHYDLALMRLLRRENGDIVALAAGIHMERAASHKGIR
jgi:hypothetical protein